VQTTDSRNCKGSRASMNRQHGERDRSRNAQGQRLSSVESSRNHSKTNPDRSKHNRDLAFHDYDRRRVGPDQSGSGDPSSSDEESGKDRSRRRGRRRSCARYRQSNRRRNASPDGDWSWRSDDGSSTEDDSVKTGRSNGPLRIKLQKFDGSSSWETSWANFKNCASYNRWTVLCGNAAQVLSDTDRPTIGSFQKFVDMLKSRYSGERQAEKYRVELHTRRRRQNESLSDLHQDIRRLMALAYPKLMAEAREE